MKQKQKNTKTRRLEGNQGIHRHDTAQHLKEKTPKKKVKPDRKKSRRKWTAVDRV